MKETKKFFDANKLNKGYGRENSNKLAESKLHNQFKHILPPVNVLAEYEELNPGTIDKILDMAQKEQNHRHSMDLLTIEKHDRASKLGRRLAIVLMAIIISGIIALAFNGHYIVASILAVSAFITINKVSTLSANVPATKTFYKNFNSRYKGQNHKPRKLSK